MMSRLLRNAKTKALRVLEDEVSDDELQYPRPLSQRIGIGRSLLSTSRSSFSSTTLGRQILGASHASSSSMTIGRGLLSVSSSSSTTVDRGNLLALNASLSFTGAGRDARPSRITKEKANQALQESDDSASEESGSESESAGSDAESVNESDTGSESDTEIEIGSGEDRTNKGAAGESFCGRDGTLWAKKPFQCGRSPAQNVMRCPGGLSVIGRRLCQETALSNWRLFFDDALLDTIVDCTNEKARGVKGDCVTNRNEVAT